MKYLVLVALLGLMSCKTAPKQVATQEVIEEGHVELLSSEAFQEKIDALNEANIEFTLLDVRTPAELQNGGYMDNAININFYDEDFTSQLSLLDKEKPVLMYCRSGGRSGKSSVILKDLGFKEVYDLDGGMNGWKDAGDGDLVIVE